jgi:sarcosine oxidase
MAEPFDVAILGLGVMGSAVACELASRGRRVVGVERYWPVHDLGSSHGESRILRRTQFEHPDYVPLALRAYELWDDLAARSRRSLRLPTGGLVIGRPDGAVLRGSLESAARHGLDHHVLEDVELRRRYPMLHIEPGEVGLYEEATSVLLAEECVRTLQQLAIDGGAELRFGVRVSPGSVRTALGTGQIRLEAPGHRIDADHLVIAAGPWVSGLLADGRGASLTAERLVMYWFDPASSRPAFAPGRFPVCLWDHPEEPFCAFPHLDGPGVKVARQGIGATTDPESVRRDVGTDEISGMRRRLARAVPALDRPPSHTSVCMYTNAPDGHFVLGPLNDPRIVIASACSGHGFKFAPVVGEIVSDLLTRGVSRHRIDLFRPDRAALRAEP